MALKSDHIRELLLAIAISLFAAMAFYFSAKAGRHSVEFFWPCFRFSEPGHGVTSASAVPGKSLLAWLCWARPQRCISRWSGGLRLLQERSLPWLLGIAPSCLSLCLFIFICFGVSQMEDKERRSPVRRRLGTRLAEGS